MSDHTAVCPATTLIWADFGRCPTVIIHSELSTLISVGRPCISLPGGDRPKRQAHNTSLIFEYIGLRVLALIGSISHGLAYI